MKIRAKLGRDSRTIDLGQREASVITLGDLRQAVTTQFHLENYEFQLSLNKQDILSGDEKLLSDVGIVSGDLLHVMGSDLPQINQSRNSDRVQNRVQPISSWASNDSMPVSENQVVSHSKASVSATSKSSSDSGICQTTGTCVDKSKSEMDTSEFVQAENENGSLGRDSAINRALQEPLVVRESTANRVPVLLSQLYTSVSCNSTNDALWVVLHTLMLESGFLPTQSGDPTAMPCDWKRAGFYSCGYDYNIAADKTGGCSLVGVTLGNSIAVHAFSSSGSSFKTDHLQLKSIDFVRTLSQDVPETYRALDRLSRQFKDTICGPLINEIVTAAGYPEMHGLLALPFEAKLRVMSFLDAKALCHLGSTCLEMCAMYKDKTLWRLLYLKDFGRPDDLNLGRNWFTLYKEKLIQHREEQERRRQIFHLDETEPPWRFPGAGPFHPLNPRMPFPPQIIGGDYDLNPEFAAGIPNPMGSGRRGPGPRFPGPGIRDPFDPGLRGLGFPGRPRPGRGNMTGSPFSTPFSRGPFM